MVLLKQAVDRFADALFSREVPEMVNDGVVTTILNPPGGSASVHARDVA